jgi:hypothetical protein
LIWQGISGSGPTVSRDRTRLLINMTDQRLRKVAIASFAEVRGA